MVVVGLPEILIVLLVLGGIFGLALLLRSQAARKVVAAVLATILAIIVMVVLLVGLCRWFYVKSRQPMAMQPATPVYVDPEGIEHNVGPDRTRYVEAGEELVRQVREMAKAKEDVAGKAAPAAGVSEITEIPYASQVPNGSTRDQPSKPAKDRSGRKKKTASAAEQRRPPAVTEDKQPAAPVENGQSPAKAANEKPAAKADSSQPAAAEKRSEASPTVTEKSEPSESAKRPAWVDALSGRVGDAYQMTVTAGPHVTDADCQRDLPEKLRQAVQQYAELYLGRQARGRIELSGEAILSEQPNLVGELWRETIQTSVGPMKQLHARLVFAKEANLWLQQKLHEGIVAQRLWHLGVGLTAVLTLLGVLWAYLRIDLATGGSYRRRLKLAAIAAILGIAAFGVLAVSS